MKKAWRPRCYICGLFMSYEDCTHPQCDTPDGTGNYEYAHEECWERFDEKFSNRHN